MKNYKNTNQNLTPFLELKKQGLTPGGIYGRESVFCPNLPVFETKLAYPFPVRARSTFCFKNGHETDMSILFQKWIRNGQNSVGFMSTADRILSVSCPLLKPNGHVHFLSVHHARDFSVTSLCEIMTRVNLCATRSAKYNVRVISFANLARLYAYDSGSTKRR